jgi:carboxypeptidase Q
MSAAMECDMGVFTPVGVRFTGSERATAIMREIMALAAGVNATGVAGGGGGTDVSPWLNVGVPGVSMDTRNERYFDYHHTNADEPANVDPAAMDQALATWAIAIYGIASLEGMLPRDDA